MTEAATDPAPLAADEDHAAAAAAFIARWQGVAASELATAQSFVIELCALLGVDKPHATPEQDYMFERPVTFQHGDGSTSSGRIDCYRRGRFVLEAKKLKAPGHTRGFDDGMLRARSQAEGYARALPAPEGRPPFLLVLDVGNVIEVYAEFSQSGATYTPFPDPRSHRLLLADLARADVRERLRRIWLAPDSLNPALISAEVTRGVAAVLARLARSLEAGSAGAANGKFEPNTPSAGVQQAQVAPEKVANFLTRCLFSMFAEDVELLPRGAFQKLLQTHRDDPATLREMLRMLWRDMDQGGFSAVLAGRVLHFNGKLFKGAGEDGYSLLLTPAQIGLLIEAARANWREVEPAIFGTLLERALDPAERHALGAHYTPRAYVERLVLPTVIEPLRSRWQDVRAAALVLAREAAALDGRAAEVKLAQARAQIRDFHHHLCSVRVLDPACGSANFLYVTLEHLKRLEGEVVNALQELGQAQDQLGFAGETVTLQQLLGIELNERAAALAELVLWIGWLQWHIRTRGRASVAEPVVHAYGNIERRDAVLAWDAREPAYDAAGRLRTRWNGTSFRPHPVTGELVPDEAAQVPQERYAGARRAAWPQADFIVGNPPFIGAGAMRAALGDGYVEALRGAWPEVPDSADFVMFWWQHAAAQVASGQAQRMGLITTNSLRQTFNRRVVQAALDAGTHLELAVPDHPWVDSANGAAVRIAMTVLAAGAQEAGQLLTVTHEQAREFGEVDVQLRAQDGLIHADLSVGANVAAAQPLRANGQISNTGVKLHGAGFIVTRDDAAALGLGSQTGLERHIREYRNGRDLTDKPRDVMVIDLAGLQAEEVRERYPAVYQWIFDRVKPERDLNREEYRRLNWWLFGRKNTELRAGLLGLPRYIATVETAKHRIFQFLDASILPDNMLVAIAVNDAYTLGVLSSQLHIDWALATGSRLGVGNDPRYNKSRCFETFPFPADDTGLTPTLRERIAHLAEQIDAHRKRVLSAGHAGLTLTGLYNVLSALRGGRALTPKEKSIHTHGLVGVLRELHDELDAAVLAAYGLPPDAGTQAVLTHLVQLNARRAQEEAQGQVRWLRPEFQNPQQSLSNQELLTLDSRRLKADLAQKDPAAAPAGAVSAQPWPSSLPEQVRAVAGVLAASGAALSLPAIEAHFKGRGPWKKSLPTLLHTLEAVGRAQPTPLADGTPAWRG
ncbi:SAM-dependent methyltransferase [Melaminivora suipulveris]|uniref:site-specific DNA-methyltransferase (adenine-specific) n=1 Tax=Melaminivora suipulveris TaxID=2109913 RepID=A0A2R3Q956_9BURK|nr:DNA methyltransferase [Melaminivora suipulveris]AVO48316.1 SAM-dependent methyltransferase [Melaminivora suipulveris]